MISVPSDVGKKMLDLRHEVGHFLFVAIENKRLSIPLLEVIARPLFLNELETIEKTTNLIFGHIVHEWICEKTIIHATRSLDYLLNKEKAGVIKAIAEAIIKGSSLHGEEDLLSRLEKKRKEAQSPDKQIENFILSALKTASIKDLKNTSVQNYVELIARSESILNTKILNSKKGPSRFIPPVPEGFESIPIDKESILSKDNANVVNIKTITDLNNILG